MLNKTLVVAVIVPLSRSLKIQNFAKIKNNNFKLAVKFKILEFKIINYN